MEDPVDRFVLANGLLAKAIRQAFWCDCGPRCTHVTPQERAVLDNWLERRWDGPAVEFSCRITGCTTRWLSPTSRHLHERAHRGKGVAA